MYSSTLRPQNDTVLTVTQLNRQVGRLLEGNFSRIWVRGEISNFTQAASGHWYFSVKDEGATVRAVMFRARAQAVGFVPKPGERFEFRANVTLYEPRGDYQLQVDSLRRAGRGDLHEAFLLLKERLAAEGLFDAARKLDINPLPKAVGVVTSLAAAALRDVLAALARRAPHIRVVVYPAPVQGPEAAAQLTDALQTAVQRAEVDTLLLVRGGGSLEDLWSFNDEALARAIVQSPIPVISGVGHETDFTIADFVADLRAPTPTAAAELCCRSRESCMTQVMAAYSALNHQQSRVLERSALRLDRAIAMLVSPQQRLSQQAERLQALVSRLVRAGRAPQERHAAQLLSLCGRLMVAQPEPARLRLQFASRAQALAAAATRLLSQKQQRLTGLQQTLQALSPTHVLERGYAIVRNEQGLIIKNALDLSVDEHVDIELGQGGAQVRVLHTRALL